MTSVDALPSPYPFGVRDGFKLGVFGTATTAGEAA
jgi:hypothetical protein